VHRSPADSSIGQRKQQRTLYPVSLLVLRWLSVVHFVVCFSLSRSLSLSFSLSLSPFLILLLCTETHLFLQSMHFSLLSRVQFLNFSFTTDVFMFGVSPIFHFVFFLLFSNFVQIFFILFTISVFLTRM
jgi:hypothetical protein